MKETILITGGTGFLGKRLATQLKANYRVVLAGRNHKQNLGAKQFTDCEVLPLDVARIDSVRDTFMEVKPSIVIHAAATKFVDVAEQQPLEAVDVNVVGSENVARLAMETGCRLVVGISTDKASPPVRNTYGLTKALMERMFCSLDGKSKTAFVCVRYGNVAWSTGSVLCLWKQMLAERGVIGTTGPEMRRFFFTVDEAVQLVLTAMHNSDTLRGKVLSREMAAAQMQEILEVWTKAQGGRWEVIDGRPGERTDEYLIGDLELPYTEEIIYDGIRHFVISFNKRSANPPAVALSSANTRRLSAAEILTLIENPPQEEA